MDRINKIDINDISIWYVYQINQLNFWTSRIYLDYETFVMQDLL